MGTYARNNYNLFSNEVYHFLPRNSNNTRGHYENFFIQETHEQKSQSETTRRKFNGWERDGDGRRVTLCFKLFHVVSGEEDDSKLLGLKVLTKADGAPDLIARILVDLKTKIVVIFG